MSPLRRAEIRANLAKCRSQTPTELGPSLYELKLPRGR